jgi:hypothetical protein
MDEGALRALREDAERTETRARGEERKCWRRGRLARDVEREYCAPVVLPAFLRAFGLE